MSTFALIFDGAVVQTNPTQFEVHNDLTWVDVTAVSPAPQVGWAYNGSTFTAPPTPPQQSPSRVISPLAFMGLFNASETTAIHTAALASPAVFGWLLQCAAAGEIDLDDPLVKTGLDALVTSGLLTSTREAAILAA